MLRKGPEKKDADVVDAPNEGRHPRGLGGENFGSKSKLLQDRCVRNPRRRKEIGPKKTRGGKKGEKRGRPSKAKEIEGQKRTQRGKGHPRGRESIVRPWWVSYIRKEIAGMPI